MAAELIARLDLDIGRVVTASKQAETSINKIVDSVQKARAAWTVFDEFGRKIEGSGKFAKAASDDFVRWGEAVGTASARAAGSLGPVKQRADETALSLRRFTHEGLGDLLAQVPVVGGALSRLSGAFSVLTGTIGIALAAGALLIKGLVDLEHQADATLLAVGNMAEDISTKFQAALADIEAVRARAAGNIPLAITRTQRSTEITAEGEHTTGLNTATAERDKRLKSLNLTQAVLESIGVGPIAKPVLDLQRGQAETTFKVTKAKLDEDAVIKLEQARARAQAEVLQFEREQQAAALQTAAVRTQAVLEVAQIEATAAHDRLGQIQAGLASAVQKANDERAQKIQALGPAVGPGDPRVVQANDEAQTKITVATAQAVAQRRAFEESLANTELQLRQEVVASHLAANAQIVAAVHERAQAELAAQAEVRAAAGQRVETQRSVSGDTVGAAQQQGANQAQGLQDQLAAARESAAAKVDTYKADLSAFRQNEQTKLETYNQSLDQQYGKTSEIEARIAQARGSGRDEEANQLQATLDRVTALRAQKAQASGEAVAAQEQSTANRIAGIQTELGAKEQATQDRIAAANIQTQAAIENAIEARAQKQAEVTNRIATAEQSVSQARSSAENEAIQGEAEVEAARLQASGNARAAEEVLGQARIEGIRRALDAEVQRHQTVIANAERELAVQQEIAANNPDQQARLEAQTKVAELTAQIGVEQAGIAGAEARSSAEIEKQNIALDRQRNTTSQIRQDAQALTEAYRAQAQASQSLLQAQLGTAKTISGLMAQLSQVGAGASFAFVQDPALRAQIESLRESVVTTSGAQRIAANQALQAFLEAHKDQLDADRAAQEIMNEQRALSERRNQILEQIQAAQDRVQQAIVDFRDKVLASMGAQLAQPTLGHRAGGLIGYQHGGVIQARDLLRAQAGVLVPGSGSGDIVPALLEPGELVLPKALTRSLIETVNRHGATHFASGGVVKIAPSAPPGLPGELITALRGLLDERGGRSGRREPMVVQLVVDRKVLAHAVIPEARKEGGRGVL